MYHWDMILILLLAELLAIFSLVRAFIRLRSIALKFFIPAVVLGISTELLLFSLKGWGTSSSGWWDAWLFVHLPASLALDPLHLPLRVWDWVTVGLYSLIATAIWFFVLRRIPSSRKPRAA